MKKSLLILFLLSTMTISTIATPIDIRQFSRIAEQSATEEVAFTITHKEVQGSGRYANLVLTGQHDTYGNIAIYLDSYNGSYKTYTVYYAMIGNVEVSGEAAWSHDGSSEIVDATLATRDGSRTFHVLGTYTPDTSVTLNFSGFSKYGYDPNYGDWYMEIYGNDPGQPEYQYKLVLAYYAPSNNGLGTFTSADNQINMVDSYILTPDGAYVMFDSVTLNMEMKRVSDNLKQTIATATLVGQNGVTYHVTCTHNSITPSSQFTAQIPNATLLRTEDAFTFAGQNAEYDIAFTVNSSTLLGKHAMKEIDLSKSYFLHNADTLHILSIQAEVTTKTIANDLACVAQLAFLTQDTVQYVLTMIHTLPTPADTLTINCSDLLVNDDLSEILGVVEFSANNDHYTIAGTWTATEAQPGTYTNDMLTIQLHHRATDILVHALDATISAHCDEIGHWSIVGYMRGDDNVLYTLNLDYVVPTPTDTVIVRFDHAASAQFSPDMNNDLYFDNEDQHYFASLNIRGVAMGDSFTIHDVDREYCGVKDSITGEYSTLADINGRIFQTGDTTIMQAHLISMDAILYDIELWYVAPTPTDTVTMAFPVTFGDLRSEQGYYQLYGPSPDTTYAVAFSPISEQIEGTFVNDGMFGRFGAEGGRMELEHRNTYIVTMKDMVVLEMMPIEKGQMTVDMDEEGNITAVAEVVCANRVLYHITMTSKYERVYLRGDAPSGAVDEIYTAADEVVTSDFSEDGYIYFAVADADASDLMAMHFFVDSTDADILIPEGVYKINKSYHPGTVLASSGPTDDNQLSTPFYATVDANGYLNNVYMWVRGTVEVKNLDGNLYIEVNAFNSYDVPVHIIYDGTGTAVENIPVPDDDCQKRIVNGQLLIQRGDKTFNVLGTSVQ